MAKYAGNCCCGRPGLCTTRWYPTGWTGDPEDVWAYDHGTGTSRVAFNHVSDEWYTWILGANLISKVRLPADEDPKLVEPDFSPLNIAEWRKPILYEPPAGAVGESMGAAALTIYEMRTVDTDNLHAVIIGAGIATRLLDTAFGFGAQLQFDYDIVQPDYVNYDSNAAREAMAAANEIGKVDIGFRSSDADASSLTPIQVATGGFFRCEINQWLGDLPCGTLYFEDNATSGSVAWVTPEGAEEDDAAAATADGIDELSHYLFGTFDFSRCISEDAQSIDGVTVTISRWADSDLPTANITDELVSLRVNNLIVGSNKADTVNVWPTAEAGQSYGGATDTWGLALTVDDVRSASGPGWFGMALQVDHAPNGAKAFVNQIGMVVDYTDADGDPQTVTISDVILFEPGVNGITVRRNFSDYGDTYLRFTGITTQYLAEPIPFDISGADLAAIIQPYLDPRYTAAGSGTMTDSTDITLTFTHDGSIDPDYAAPGGRASELVAVSVIHAFPDEAASVHLLDNDGGINWSRCGNQRAHYNGYAGISAGGQPLRNLRLVNWLHVDPDEEIITVRGGDRRNNTEIVNSNGNYRWNRFDLDGEPLDCGAYAGGQILNVTGERRSYIYVDLDQGYGYSQDLVWDGDDPPSYILSKYGPEGILANETLVWTCDLGWEILQIIGDPSDPNVIYVAGWGKVAMIDPSGVVQWESEIPTNATAVGMGAEPRDIWSDGAVVVVAASFGAYQYLAGTGELTGYFPHGAKCYSAFRVETGSQSRLILTGLTADIEIEEDRHDIDPITLT